MNENTHRENVEDVINNCLFNIGLDSEADDGELTTEIANDVLEVLGITTDEQNSTGGYFMLHADKGEKQFVPPKPRAEAGEKAIADKELIIGKKLSVESFRGSAIAVRSGETGGWYISLHAKFCKYGQAYDKDVCLSDALMNFCNYYYQLYLDDYERSESDYEMDKE